MPYCVLHPADAAARNLNDGQIVRLVNDRGAVGLRLRVRDEVQPGVVLVPGQRPDEESRRGTVNMLCADAFTDMGEAPPIRAPGWTCVPGSAQSAARGMPRSGRCRTNWSSMSAATTSRRSR